MRWNPKHPGTHQYATDVRWAQVQATIKSLYEQIELKANTLFAIDTNRARADSM